LHLLLGIWRESQKGKGQKAKKEDFEALPPKQKKAFEDVFPSF